MSRRALRDPIAALCLGASSAWAMLVIWHAAHAHLLADDYAILAQTSEASVRQILTTDLFSFYRPLGALTVKALQAALNPTHSGWSLFMLTVHVGNAILVGRIVARLFRQSQATWLAGTFFLLSPWAAEGYLWLGPVFDVGTTAWTLGAVRFALAASDRQRGAIPFWLGAVASCGLAAGFKESGLLSPLIVGGVLLTDNPQIWRSLRAWVAGAFALAAVMCVFLMRSSVVVDSSTYTVGAYVNLLTGPTALASFASAPLALAMWPMPNTLPPVGPWLNVLLVWPVGLALVPVLLVSQTIVERRLVSLVLVTIASYLPTAFFHLTAASITPRRYLYLSGLTWAILIGAVTARSGARMARSTATLVTASLLLAALASVAAQVRLWNGAHQVARCAIEDFGRRALGSPRPIYVDNVPFVVDSGPFIVIDYDFHYAHLPASRDLDVVYRNVTLHVDERGRFSVSGAAAEPVGIEGRDRITLDLCLPEGR